MAIATADPRLSINWIVGRRTDLVCFIGAALLGYIFFYLHAGLRWNLVTVWFIWHATLDTPHLFQTISRTYMDRQEMRTRRPLLLGSLGFFLLGPVIILIGYGLFKADVTWYRTPFLILVAFVSLWAYWHVVRQHYGIMSLYKRKNNDHQKFDRLIDQAVLYVGLVAPFARGNRYSVTGWFRSGKDPMLDSHG